MLGRSYWPMLAMLSLPYTGYAHAILYALLCWCFILAYSDSSIVGTHNCPDIGVAEVEIQSCTGPALGIP